MANLQLADKEASGRSRVLLKSLLQVELKYSFFLGVFPRRRIMHSGRRSRVSGLLWRLSLWPLNTKIVWWIWSVAEFFSIACDSIVHTQCGEVIHHPVSRILTGCGVSASFDGDGAGYWPTVEVLHLTDVSAVGLLMEDFHGHRVVVVVGLRVASWIWFQLFWQIERLPVASRFEQTSAIESGHTW